MSIQTAIEKHLKPLDGEIMSIDMMAQVVVSRRPESKVPGKPDERYMVHNFSINPESYGNLFWGCYDLSPAQAMDELREKIKRSYPQYRADRNENFQPLGSDQVNLKPCELFATPDSTQAMNDYLSNFSGSEAVAATTCSYMMWNLAAKLTNPETRGEI